MTNAGKADDTEKKKVGAVQETVEIVKTVVYALLIALVLRTFLFQPFTIPSASMEPNLYQGDYIIVSKWTYGWSRHSILFSPPLFHGRLWFHAPQRGDIIVFKLPRDPVKTDYIKRLVGLPGDKVQMREGQLYINDKAVQEQVISTTMADRGRGPEPVQIVRETDPEGRSYLTQIFGKREPADNTGVYVVPQHCYFMMGDNRDDSADSRFDPGLPPDDPKLGGCGWNSGVDDAVGDEQGVGFVPEENLEGKAQIILLSWDARASIFKPWTWFLDAKPSRFFKVLH